MYQSWSPSSWLHIRPAWLQTPCTFLEHWSSVNSPQLQHEKLLPTIALSKESTETLIQKNLFAGVSFYIRRPLCLAWGGGVREEQSKAIVLTASSCMLLSIHGIHPIHVSTPHNAWTCRLHGIHPIHVSTPRNAGACLLCILTVSKLQLGHREARLRTHGFWLVGLFGSVATYPHLATPEPVYCVF